MKKFLKFTLLGLCMVMLLLIIAILTVRSTRLTDKMIYANNNTYDEFSSDFNYVEQYIDVENDVKIHAVIFKPTSKPVGTIFHIPGQGMHLMSVQKEYNALIKNGFQIISFERRGFAHSTGKANNSLILKKDALFVFDRMLERNDVKNSKVIIWGQSIGGPFATMIAGARNEKICGLILEGTFGSFPELGKLFANVLKLEHAKWIVPLLMNNDFPVTDEIVRVTVPTIIIHSKEDEYIPFELGYEIFNYANKSHTDFWKIDGLHIKGIFNYENEYVNRFQRLTH